ncbi:hypothetical protein [Burkholderia ubonensis]|uniref:hypothetical protein n=1 Tax=Burkholderia ubonensis TaxID=101571 RepID=UPI000A88CA0C|nr:hypothetical protein [Burkholderia ubonensis]
MTSPDNRLRALYAYFSDLYPHFTVLEEAKGRCLSATLLFAEMACRDGIDVSLVRWRVVRNLHAEQNSTYCDHWAIYLGNGRVLDPTAVQVDKNPWPWRRLSAYPKDHIAPSVISANKLLPLIREANRAEQGSEFSEAFMRKLDAALEAERSPARRWIGIVATTLAGAAFVYMAVSQWR